MAAMNKKYQILLMKQDCIDALKINSSSVREDIKNNPTNIEWIKKYYSGEPFEKSKFYVDDFDFEIPDKIGSGCAVDNAIMLYESLHNVVPKAVLADERLWCGLIFTKGYQYAQMDMSLDEKNAIVDHWFMNARYGIRRSLFFHIIARLYFRCEYSLDEEREDPYELLRFGYLDDTMSIIRVAFWRSYSSNKEIPLGLLEGEKRLYEETNVKPIGEEIDYAIKYVSRLGSVRLLDTFSKEEIADKVYRELKRIRNI